MRPWLWGKYWASLVANMLQEAAGDISVKIVKATQGLSALACHVV